MSIPARLAAAVLLVFSGGAIHAKATGETLSVSRDDEYGAYLTGPEGYPLYTFLTERGAGDSLGPLESCKSPCRHRWPLLVLEGELTVSGDLNPELAGIFEWRGSRLVGFANRVLFRFHRDRPGEEPQGQGIFSFGGFWALVSPTGDPIITPGMPGKPVELFFDAPAEDGPPSAEDIRSGDVEVPPGRPTHEVAPDIINPGLGKDVGMED